MQREEIVFYVAPDGSDSWSGKLASPNETRSDGPFATLQRARDAARVVARSSCRRVTVFVRGGTYFLREPLVLAPEDSGITFAAYQGEKPVISGGCAIKGWKKVTVEGKQLWAAEIQAVKEGKWFFRELWVNGHRRIRARHPDRGYLKVAGDAEKTAQWSEGQTAFQFSEGDMKTWRTAEDAEVVVMCRWVDSHLPIKSIDEAKHVVTFPYRSVFQLAAGDPYYVEHAFELLDAPGEWYLDRKKGTLYYMPMADEDMDRAEVIAPVLAQVVRLEGKPESGKFVENILFRGLTFAHTEWWLPEGSSGFAQAAVGVPGAIYGEGARYCTLEECAVAHIGNYAIEFSRGCRNNHVISCALFDLGAGGVKIGETGIRDNEAEKTSRNEIRDCQIYDGGRVFHPAVGIWVGQSYDNQIVHNHIHDFYYSGLSIGWTWGYGNTLAGGNVVEFNHIHHIGVRSDGDGPILSDMGGIYTLGMQPGTVVRYNVFHDIAGIQYGGWGIYFDEGSTYIVAENNLVFRTTHGGFHQHYGKENVVRNNIFAFARDHQIQRSRPEEHSSFTFERNIVYFDRGSLIAGNFGNFNFVFDNNLYWHAGGGEIRIGNMSWKEWQEKGMDGNSLIADPLFAAPEKGDFHLKPGSPATKIGFVPFEL